MSKEIDKKLKVLLKADQKDIVAFQDGQLSKDDWTTNVEDRTMQVKEIFTQYGIAKKEEENPDAYKSMLVLVLHSGDIALIEKYLREHQEHSDSEVDIAHYMLLEDKIRVLKEKK